MPRRTLCCAWRPAMNATNAYRSFMKPALLTPFGRSGRKTGGDEERKKFMVHLARKCRQSVIPEEDAVRFALIHPFGREQEMELRATFGNVYRKEKRCSVRPCMPRRMLVGDADGRVYDEAL